MATFSPDKAVETQEPVIQVDNKLVPGEYRFQLVVVDDQGNKSVPAEIEIIVIKSGSRISRRAR